MDAQPTIAELDSALHTMLDENEALRAENKQLRADNQQLVDWVMGNTDALTCLQAIYRDADTSRADRIKAAGAAIGYERPKVNVSISVTGPAVLGDRLDQAKTVKAIIPEPKLIEHDPKPAA
jgi:hypothetical protein